LANRYAQSCLRNAVPTQSRVKISQEIKEEVVSFYQRDDITRMSPGKQDVHNFRDSQGTKQSAQKRYMTMSVNEAYEIFVSEKGKVLSRTLFFSLRPVFVYIASDTPHNVCTCDKHENFIE